MIYATSTARTMAFSEPMRRSSSAGLSGNISTVSSASVSSPRSDANAGAAAPREPFSSQVADVATGQAGTSGESHNVETGKDALKYLKSLLGDNVKLTAQLESLSSADRYMMDMVALNVLTAHKALGGKRSQRVQGPRTVAGEASSRRERQRGGLLY